MISSVPSMFYRLTFAWHETQLQVNNDIDSVFNDRNHNYPVFLAKEYFIHQG